MQNSKIGEFFAGLVFSAPEGPTLRSGIGTNATGVWHESVCLFKRHTNVLIQFIFQNTAKRAAKLAAAHNPRALLLSRPGASF